MSFFMISQADLLSDIQYYAIFFFLLFVFNRAVCKNILGGNYTKNVNMNI